MAEIQQTAITATRGFDLVPSPVVPVAAFPAPGWNSLPGVLVPDSFSRGAESFP